MYCNLTCPFCIQFQDGTTVRGPHMAPETFERVAELHEPGETVLVAPPQALGAPIAAEKLAIPFVSAFPNPLLLRSVHRPPKTPMISIPAWVGPWGVGLFYRYLERKLDRLLGEQVNAYRASLGLLGRRFVYSSWRDQAAQIIGLWPEWLYERQPDWFLLDWRRQAKHSSIGFTT